MKISAKRIKYGDGIKALTPFPPVNRLRLHIMLTRLPTSQGKTGLSSLVLKVLSEDLASLLVGNIICIIILSQ